MLVRLIRGPLDGLEFADDWYWEHSFDTGRPGRVALYAQATTYRDQDHHGDGDYLFCGWEEQEQ